VSPTPEFLKRVQQYQKDLDSKNLFDAQVQEITAPAQKEHSRIASRGATGAKVSRM
jgi:hypothetical protein